MDNDGDGNNEMTTTDDDVAMTRMVIMIQQHHDNTNMIKNKDNSKNASTTAMTSIQEQDTQMSVLHHKWMCCVGFSFLRHQTTSLFNLWSKTEYS